MKRFYRFQRQMPMRYWLVPAAASLVVLTGAALMVQQSTATAAEERTFSGPQPGEKITPFKVLQIKSEKLQELEILKETDKGPTLLCFVHKLSGDDRFLFSLRNVDFYASRQKELTSHFVLLSDDRARTLLMLRSWARGPLFSKSSVSMSVDGSEGPGDYGLNRNVTMTVLVTKGNKVVNNFVFEDPNSRDIQTILTAVAKTLGKPEPSFAKIQQELRAEGQRRRERRIRDNPVVKLAPNQELGRIMHGMLYSAGTDRNGYLLLVGYQQYISPV